MATINLGAIKFNWKGAYNSSTTYAVDDVVSSGGNSYVCIQAHSNQAVGDATAYWNIMATKGTNGTDGADADLLSIGSTTGGDIYYNSGSAIARLAKPASNKFLQNTSGGVLSWETVTSKILGYKINVNNERINKGNVSQSASTVTQLNTTYGAPVSNSSYFLVKVQLSGHQHGNHGRAFFEFSVDGGSNWSYAWSNGSDAGVSRSGTGVTFNSDNQYKYPQIAFQYETDDNSCDSNVAYSVYQPSRPHSVSDFRVRVRVFTASSTNNFIVNGTQDNGTTYGSAFSSAVEITEISA